MTWDGETVSDTLGITLHDDAKGLVPLRDLVGLALRHNPKRAHLLVSHVLGKHVPTDPHVVLTAGHLLGLMVADRVHAGQTSNHTAALVRRFGDFLTTGEGLAALMADVKAADATVAGQVIGYAETATALGASVAAKLAAPYIHSTRYPATNANFYGAFEESHSHATSHHLTPRDTALLDTDAPLVLVDDELSTGSTVINTIRMLHARQPHIAYIIATLIDLRHPVDRARMQTVADDLDTTITVVALGTGEATLPANVVADAEMYMARQQPQAMKQTKRLTTITRHAYQPVPRALQDGVVDFNAYNQRADQLAQQLPDMTGQRVLVLGIEEDMYLPLLLAARLQADQIEFSTTTRSPVFPHNTTGYAIRDRLAYNVPPVANDTSERFAYNLGYAYDNIIIVTSSEVSAQLAAPNSLYNQLMTRTTTMTVLTSDIPVPPAPLVGPAFGSYKAADVKWLLKDLSNVELEAPVEEREEAIQSGGAHYSESLPVEYQPTPEYQALFLESLGQNAQKLATAVTTVSELILERRPAPVLVSLARAGVPIGVLIKRYLEQVHHIDAPHYAVSIVRGRGIDYNAMRYLVANHNPADIIFVDGWTGKGAIVKELAAALDTFFADTGIRIPADLAVLADPGHCVELYGTRDDYLIPSACLNSTVSGLISRTVLRPDLMDANDYHGGKFYTEFADIDQSNHFLDTVAAHFGAASTQKDMLVQAYRDAYTAPDFSGWREIEKLSKAYDINSVNLVKPGVGETTRVLLRRVPWRILIREDQYDNLAHIRLLAEARGVEIVKVTDLTYSCVGLIHPKYTRGATGFDGTKA